MLRLRLANPVPQRFRGFKIRAAMVVTGMSLGLLVLAGRAFDLQVLRQQELGKLAKGQSQRTIRLKGQRGEVLDRFGAPLAVSIQSDSFFARPGQLGDPSQAATRLSKALGLPREKIAERLASDQAFVWLKRRVTPQESAAVRALDLPGVGSTHEFLRVYPNRALAAALLGFTGVDTQGLEGLEYAYDSHLKGAEGYRVIDRDALGRTLFTSESANPTAGGSVALTLHPAIQHIAEAELALAVERHAAVRGVAVVIRSQTGEILALAQAPGFNPNDFAGADRESTFNRAVTSGYEPGSTFKIVTAAAALELGAVKPDASFYCENGKFELADSVIHDTEPHEWLDLRGILQVSSNICAAKIGLQIPKAAFREMILRFGFGERVGLFVAADGRRLAGEAEGFVLPLKKWTSVDQAAVSFGHGVLVSPLQMAMAANTLATDGILLRPYIVREARDARGRIVERNEPTRVRRVISAETARRVREFLVAVTEEGGTGVRAAVPGFQVAGKTGTTEQYELEARNYSKTRTVASFAGLIPAEAPELTILVAVEDPRRGRHGSVVAAPVFREIARRSLPLLGIWPKEGVRRVALSAGGKPR